MEEVGAAMGRMGYKQEQRDRRLRVMREHFPEALVGGHDELAKALECIPDENDRHVLAAAICGHANTVVTFNEKHFPQECLEPYGILRQHPDEFLVHQFHLSPALLIEKIDSQAIAIHQTRKAVIDSLRDSRPSANICYSA